ncbi:hypothetical protein [Pseudodesulfovibrio sp. zrk46]|uniref:hypothetical protein n=1 Tax=Pseudodesulfovibrio sp. zrk46 TaxID=2725288 RepID=UPI0014493446|nr:hypothetical protein [Pseudodesulfovibrio sp. zrk46]QJB57457.1 hypothetical protein HFN16_14035 [Pseudodesulfovibrio sp. zrk46]
MLNFLAQLDYLRDVQRTFGSGADRLDMIGVFSKILSIVVPLVLAMALWYYRRIIGFYILRFFARLFAPRSRRIVENYLVTKGVMLDVYVYSSSGVGKNIGQARVSEVVGGKMILQLVNVAPTALKFHHTRVVCYTKPFTYSGRKINAFVTFITHVVKRGSVIKEMSLATPIRYKFVIRRKHSRQRVAREGTVRVKAWDVRKRKTFWMGRPDLQTINNPARYGNKMRLSVENISAGGMRILVIHPSGKLPPLKEGAQLVLRVSIWNPKTKKFAYFNVIGAIRSRFKGKGGAIGLGIQFTAEGENVGGKYVWKSLSGEMKALSQFLEKISG